MKRNAIRSVVIWMLGLSLLLTACVRAGRRSGPETAGADKAATGLPHSTAAAQPSTGTAAPESVAPAAESAAIPTKTAAQPSAESAGPEPTDPVTEPSQPPFQPLPGDTTVAWDPARADAFPPDAACSPWQFLTKWMCVEGLDFSDLDALGCRQLLLVSAQADGVTMRASCYEKDDGGSWQPVHSLLGMDGWVGANGIAHDRRRYSDTSPAGLWSLGPAFGNAEKPEGLRLAWRDVTPQSDWVCDADSVYFNTWQERGDPNLLEAWDYDDAEHLEDYPRCYAYACVIGYNLPPDPSPDRGCAIFLHCATGATGGCVGLPEQEMRRVLTWLDPELHPYILISGRA